MRNSKISNHEMTLEEALRIGSSDHEESLKEVAKMNEDNRKDPSLLVNFLRMTGQIKD